jgi:hypothetical protein
MSNLSPGMKVMVRRDAKYHGSTGDWYLGIIDKIEIDNDGEEYVIGHWTAPQWARPSKGAGVNVSCPPRRCASARLRAVRPPQLAASPVAEIIVRESRAAYGRPCACPDDLVRNGSRCGGRPVVKILPRVG